MDRQTDGQRDIYFKVGILDFMKHMAVLSRFLVHSVCVLGTRDD